MKKDFEITEINFVVIGRNHNPTILNPDFLKYNKIVPEDWNLAKNPVCLEPIAEVLFENSIKISAQLDKVIFFQKMSSDPAEKIHIDNIAIRYVETLPHVQYLAVGLNFKGHVQYQKVAEEPQRFIFKHLIASGPWQEYGIDRKATISFNYNLENCVCNLTIKEAGYKLSNEEVIPALLFESNFHHELVGESPGQKLENLKSVLSNWRSDMSQFVDLAETVFLNYEA